MSMFGNAFKPGGAGRDIAGYIGDALASIGGVKPIYGPSKMQERQQELEYQRQMQLAQYKAQNPQPTDIMREAQAMGLQQGTPQFNKFVTDWRMKQPMIVLGNPENGQTIVPPSAVTGGAPGGIDPAAIARLKANPGEASLFDAHFGPGSAASVLGGR